MNTHYKNLFDKISLTDYFRTLFDGQKQLDFFEVEELLTGQKELNTKLRKFFSDYVMPVRFVDSDYAVTQKDAVLLINMTDRNKQNFISRVARNRKKEKDLFDIAEKAGKMDDSELSKAISLVIDKPNVADRLFRVMRTPDELIEREIPEKKLDELHDKCEKLDTKIKEIYNGNYASIFFEDMRVRLFFEKGIKL